MRTRMSKKSAGLAVLAMVSMMAAGTGARAADAVGSIVQAGNGQGLSEPINGLSGIKVATMLFNANHFPDNQGRPRTSFNKYISWGTKDGTNQVFFIKGTDDGLRWTTPNPATLQLGPQCTPAGGQCQTVPLLIQPGSNFAVVYNTLNFINNNPYPSFELYYVPAGVAATSTSDNPAQAQISGADTDVNAIHIAVSDDGITFFDDRPVQQFSTQQTLIDGAACASFKCGTNGPLQVLFNPAGSINYDCGTAGPFACLETMYYDVIGSDGKHRIAVAGGAGGYYDQSAPFIGTSAPALPSSVEATGGHVRKVGNGWELYYSALSPTTATLGVATSSNGVTFTPFGANPVASGSVIDQFLNTAPSSLTNPWVFDDDNGSGHAKVFFDRQLGSGNAEWLGYTAPAASSPLSISVASPTSVVSSVKNARIELYIQDTSPSAVSFDTAHFSMTIDGTPVTGATFARTIIGSTTKPGYKILASGPNLNLPDGPHTFAVSLTDLGGNTASAASTFIVDSTPTTTKITRSPPGNVLGYQLAMQGSLGTFNGTVADAGTSSWNKVAKMHVVVTNPLGDQRSYVSGTQVGWFFTPDLPTNATDWRYAAEQQSVLKALGTANTIPQVDLFYAIPGSYAVTITGIDLAGNIEQASPDNTAFVQVI